MGVWEFGSVGVSERSRSDPSDLSDLSDRTPQSEIPKSV